MKVSQARKKLKALCGFAKIDAETVQTLINLGELERAQEELEKTDKSQIWVFEKQGWVHELMGMYQEAETDFQKVLDTSQSDDPSYKTAIHFIGRAKFGLNKINEARKQFEQDLKEGIQSNNKFRQAYNLRWLAQCDLKDGKIKNAREKLTRIWKLIKGGEKSGIWAHMLVLEGLICVEENNLEYAREVFTNARQLWQRDDLYVRGAADALVGLAVCDLLEGKQKEAIKKSRQAFLEHKWVWEYLS